MHRSEPHGEGDQHQPRPHQVGDGQVHLAEEPATDRPDDHGNARHDRSAGEDPVELVAIARGVQGVDHPGLHRTGIEGVAEAEDHACQAEQGQPSVDGFHPNVCQSPQGQRGL